MGLSPSLRGNLIVLRIPDNPTGSIPAPAGEPLVGDFNARYFMGRSIPAPAGEPVVVVGIREATDMGSIPAPAGEPLATITCSISAS